MKELKKTCSGCQHYDAWYSLCMAPVPHWLENYDPLGHITRDENRRMAPDDDAAYCAMYRKARGGGKKGMGGALKFLTDRFRDDGHEDAAAALEEVDFWMREYGFTRDDLSEGAMELSAGLRRLVAEWVAGESEGEV